MLIVVLKGMWDCKQKVVWDMWIWWIIVNFELLYLLEGYLFEVDFVIVDEAMWVKNYKAWSIKVLLCIVEGKRFWLLIGILVLQYFIDVYMGIWLLCNGNYKSFKWFCDLTMLWVMQFMWKFW